MRNPRRYITIDHMIKLSVTLPSGAQVSIEADDKDLVREVLFSTMPQLNATAPPPVSTAIPSPAPSAAPAAPPNYSLPIVPDDTRSNSAEPNAPQPANGRHPPSAETSAEPVKTRHQAAVATPPPQPANPEPTPLHPEPAAVAASKSVPPPQPSAPYASPSTPNEHEFIAFCQRVNPLGDMRRVVVAAEAADRHLGVKSVDPDELSRLFTLAGWPIPHSFVQTLRNAARSKFRWMERIQGQLGHYHVTNAGRKIVLGENADNPSPALNKET